MLPLRLPIIRPSSAEKPIVAATLFRPIMPQRLAPLPRWAPITRPCASSPWRSASAIDWYS